MVFRPLLKDGGKLEALRLKAKNLGTRVWRTWARGREGPQGSLREAKVRAGCQTKALEARKLLLLTEEGRAGAWAARQLTAACRPRSEQQPTADDGPVQKAGACVTDWPCSGS